MSGRVAWLCVGAFTVAAGAVIFSFFVPNYGVESFCVLSIATIVVVIA